MSKLGGITVLNVAVFVAAGSIAVAAPSTTEVGPRSTRLAGADRYETAVAISRGAWGDSNDAFTVFLASGVSFADALALAASTFDEGPILLTPRDQLPAIVAEEIRRLQPCEIVAVGGSAAISDQVIRQAEAETSRADCP